MPIVLYRGISTATTSGPGVAQNIIVNKGRLVGVQFKMRGVGGAGWGAYVGELAINNTGQTNSETSAPSRLVSSASYAFTLNTTTPGSQTTPYVPTDVPVFPGDILCLNVATSGTAGTAMAQGYDAFVME